MNCRELTNDQMLAPNAEASNHLAACEDCRERQKAMTLAARALRAMVGESAFPESNDRAVRAAIPRLAVDAARRRPAGWWQVVAAAAVLLAAVGGGLKWAESRRPAVPAGAIASSKEEPAPDGRAFLPANTTVQPPGPDNKIAPVPPPVDPAPDTVKPPIPEPPQPPPPQPPGGTGFVAQGPIPPPPTPPVIPPPDVKVPPLVGRVPRDAAGIVECMQIVKGLLGSSEPVSCDLDGDGKTGVADAMIAARLAAAARRTR